MIICKTVKECSAQFHEHSLHTNVGMLCQMYIVEQNSTYSYKIYMSEYEKGSKIAFFIVRLISHFDDRLQVIDVLGIFHSFTTSYFYNLLHIIPKRISLTLEQQPIDLSYLRIASRITSEEISGKLDNLAKCERRQSMLSLLWRMRLLRDKIESHFTTTKTHNFRDGVNRNDFWSP